MKVEFQETNDEYGHKVHIQVDGRYHCTCETREEAERVAAERFPI